MKCRKNPGALQGTPPSQLKPMFAAHLDEAKKGICTRIKELIKQVYDDKFTPTLRAVNQVQRLVQLLLQLNLKNFSRQNPWTRELTGQV